MILLLAKKMYVVFCFLDDYQMFLKQKYKKLGG